MKAVDFFCILLLFFISCSWVQYGHDHLRTFRSEFDSVANDWTKTFTDFFIDTKNPNLEKQGCIIASDNFLYCVASSNATYRPSDTAILKINAQTGVLDNHQYVSNGLLPTLSSFDYNGTGAIVIGRFDVGSKFGMIAFDENLTTTWTSQYGSGSKFGIIIANENTDTPILIFRNPKNTMVYGMEYLGTEPVWNYQSGDLGEDQIVLNPKSNKKNKGEDDYAYFVKDCDVDDPYIVEISAKDGKYAAEEVFFTGYGIPQKISQGQFIISSNWRDTNRYINMFSYNDTNGWFVVSVLVDDHLFQKKTFVLGSGESSDDTGQELLNFATEDGDTMTIITNYVQQSTGQSYYVIYVFDIWGQKLSSTVTSKGVYQCLDPMVVSFKADDSYSMVLYCWDDHEKYGTLRYFLDGVSQSVSLYYSQAYGMIGDSSNCAYLIFNNYGCFTVEKTCF